MKSTKSYYAIGVTLLAFLASSTSSAQTISAGVDREKIRIGEKILLTIKVEDVKPNSINSWLNFPDTVNHFEVVERGKIDTIKVDGTVNYQQIINITSFDSGRWQIPALSLPVANGTVLKTNSIEIDILPVDVSHLKDYNDVKEIVEVEGENSKLLIILLIIATLIALAIVIWLTRNKKKLVQAPKVVDNRLPLEWAIAELNKLRDENLPSQGLVKQFYQRFTDISRQYFYRQLNHSAIHQTTDEWMLALQDLPIDNQAKTPFFQSIRLADTVKFAKYLPPQNEHENSLLSAVEIFKSVAAWKASTMQGAATPRQQSLR